MDLTGATTRLEIRVAICGDLLHRLDTANGGLALGGAEEMVLIQIPPQVSSAWRVPTADCPRNRRSPRR
ncbi:hypothetical protein [Sinosporangium siamense]|uniref:Uncharacterized protein n=1 Tax=Sinosporangium siamense TaxID=1367973 RepID=A0A919RMY2_9ACTN|nr:hypothetical protein [Sinosporangium siamense]GII95126.1 hypothetical protein Ssi02_53570 [Sinosporangium siamense]